ncbi:MAG: hypothetical protein GPJ54_07320 [Candidatus Heimdallarchaeota archaeon]|nr:hypothetical protein [Candidatus Heimdallarchaeota archaeon]
MQISFILFALVLFISAIQALRIHRLLGSRDFLLFSFIFVLLGIHSLLIGDDRSFDFARIVVFLGYMWMTHLILINIAKKIKLITFKLTILYSIITFLILIFYFLEIYYFETITFLRHIVVDVLIIIIGIEFFIAYIDVEIIHKTKKILIGRYAWIVASIVLIITGLIRTIAFTSVYFEMIGSQDNISVDVWLQNDIILRTDVAISLLFATLAFVFVTTVFITPELLLMSKYQIFNSLKLYNIIEGLSTNYGEIPDKSGFSSIDSTQTIINYIKEIAPAVKDINLKKLKLGDSGRDSGGSEKE